MSSVTASAEESSMAVLPFIDAHTIEVKASPECVWDVLAYEVLPRFNAGLGPLAPWLVRLGGCPYTDQPPRPWIALPETLVGFRVARVERSSLVALEGEHRFARYALTFLLDPGEESATRLTAETHATFPGTAGRLYRAVVIGSGGHVLVVRRLLAQVRHLAERG